METIRFEVPGHPVPYLRMTRGQVNLAKLPPYRLVQKPPKVISMVNRIKRYWAFKDLVRLLSNGKGIDRAPKTKTYLFLRVWFNQKTHGDPDNILKAVMDAIFDKDKLVAGAVDFGYGIGEPCCQITIQQGGEDGKTIERKRNGRVSRNDRPDQG